MRVVGLALVLACGRSVLDVSPPERDGVDAALRDAAFDVHDATLDADAGSDAGEDSGVDAPMDDASLVDGSRDAGERCREGFDQTRLWPLETPTTFPAYQDVGSLPLWVDVDADGQRETVFISTDGLYRGVLRVLDDDGSVVSADHNDLSPLDHPAVGDLDGDGKLDVVTVRHAWGLRAYNHRGELKWLSRHPLIPYLGGRPVRRIGGYDPLGGFIDTSRYYHRRGGSAQVVDLEGDGRMEVVFGATVLDGPTGELRWTARSDGWQGTSYVHGPLTCIADLDGDGIQEIVAGNRAFRADGTLLWEADVRDGFCAVGNLLGDELPEVVLTAHGYLRVFNGLTGVQEWIRPLRDIGRPAIGGPPFIANVGGDSRLEVGAAAKTGITAYDPTCADCEPVLNISLEWDGFFDPDSGPAQAILAFDDRNDGVYEVIARTAEAIYLFDRGRRRGFVRNEASRHHTAFLLPVDMDDDGEIELLSGSSYIRGTGTGDREGAGDPERNRGLSLWRLRCEPLRGSVSNITHHAFEGDRGFRAIP
ncbi:MAG: hypothetical protein AAGE52_34700 [Myxococcota bacterium]